MGKNRRLQVEYTLKTQKQSGKTSLPFFYKVFDLLMPKQTDSIRCILSGNDSLATLGYRLYNMHHVLKVNSFYSIANLVIAGIIVIAAHNTMGRNSVLGKRKIVRPFEKYFWLPYNLYRMPGNIAFHYRSQVGIAGACRSFLY
jgi:hypothetical protein